MKTVKNMGLNCAGDENILSTKLSPFSELHGAALVRELHVYGKLIPTDVASSHAQNVGLGKRLMLEAERIAQEHRARKIAVISGVGVRDFYRKLGYNLEGESEMMIKYLEPLTGTINSYVKYIIVILRSRNVLLSVGLLVVLSSILLNVLYPYWG